jgi:hypothetical protein
MTTAATPPIPSFDHFTHERRRSACLRTLHARGWERRLAPLAQHMAQQHLVRGRGHVGAPLRHLDLELLRVALSGLLRDEWEDGFLIYQLVVEGIDPSLMAAQRGVSRLMLTEQLRDAIDQLAMEYEDVAYASVIETQVERMRAALARKRG